MKRSVRWWRRKLFNMSIIWAEIFLKMKRWCDSRCSLVPHSICFLEKRAANLSVSPSEPISVFIVKLIIFSPTIFSFNALLITESGAYLAKEFRRLRSHPTILIMALGYSSPPHAAKIRKSNIAKDKSLKIADPRVIESGLKNQSNRSDIKQMTNSNLVR